MLLSALFLLATAPLDDKSDNNRSINKFVFGKSAPFYLNYENHLQSYLSKYTLEFKDCSDSQVNCVIAFPRILQSLQFVLPKSCVAIRTRKAWSRGALQTYKIRRAYRSLHSNYPEHNASESWFLATKGIQGVVFKYSIRDGITDVFIGDPGVNMVGQVERGVDPSSLPYFGGALVEGSALARCER